MPLSQPPVQSPVVGGDNMMFSTWRIWIDALRRIIAPLNSDGSISPVSIGDADAANNTIYYSTDAAKLVYKDAGGTVHNLY